MAWQLLGLQGGSKGVDTQARAAAQKALELDDRLADAYVARGHLELFHDWDWKGAENSISGPSSWTPTTWMPITTIRWCTWGLGASPKRLPRYKRPNNWTHSLTRFKQPSEEFFSTPGSSRKHCGG